MARSLRAGGPSVLEADAGGLSHRCPLRTHCRLSQSTSCATLTADKRTQNSEEQRTPRRLYFRGTRSGLRGVTAFRVVHFPEID